MTKQSNLSKAQVTFRSPVFAFLFRSLPNDGVINSTDGQDKLVLLVAVPIEPQQKTNLHLGCLSSLFFYVPCQQ